MLGRVLLLLCGVCAYALDEPNDDNITKVYIVFSNHLDIGYTKNVNGSCAGAVVNQYFQEHFPKAIKTGQEARAGGRFQYRWLTQSWLVSAYRFCNSTKVNIDGPSFPSDLHCPNETELAAFEAAVRAGDIGWHAFPFNAEPETFATTELLDAAFELTFAQDDFYGHAHRHTLSQRDVPGLTRALIPALAAHNVTAISVGENSQVAPINVPSLFNWVDPKTNTSVVALFHKLGYGRRRLLKDSNLSKRDVACHAAANDGCVDDPETTIYMDEGGQLVAKDTVDPWDDGPGMHVLADGITVDASRSSHCVEVAAAGTAICYAWRVDNTGPHSYEEASLLVDAVELLFPQAAGAEKRKEGRGVVASDGFDDFIHDITPYISELPVVTAEIGDTWLFGADSDPYKVALFRAASRAHGQCVRDGGDAACLASSGDSGQHSPSPAEISALRTFERLLMVGTEHTWGWNGGNVRHKAWSNDELQKALATDEEFQTSIGTWKEQRSFVPNAVAALPAGCRLAKDIHAAFQQIWRGHSSTYNSATPRHALNATAAVRSFKSFHSPKTVSLEEHSPGDIVQCGAFEMAFGSDGAITHLQTRSAAAGSRRTHQRTVNRTWADAAHPIGRVWYKGMDIEYFKRYVDAYIAGPSAIDPEVTAENYYKPGMRLPAMSANATLVRAIKIFEQDADANRVLLEMTMPHSVHQQRGAPSSLAVQIDCDSQVHDATAWTMNYTLRWMNKTATHVPETIWLSTTSTLLTDSSARDTMSSSVAIHKVGQTVDAAEADLQCSGDRETCGVHLHGFSDEGLTISADDRSNAQTLSFDMLSLDSQLVSVGPADPVPTPLVVPDVSSVHFALVGNIWNTNYPFWYPFVPQDSSAQYRFRFTFHETETE